MKETMYDCYVSQFDCLQRLLDNRETLMAGFAEYFSKASPDRIYLVGSGTSHNACKAAAVYMEDIAKLEIIVNPPTKLKNLYGERPLVIAVSQSGRSTNTQDMVRALVSAGTPVVTLTDPKNTPVSDVGSFPMWLQADDEKIGPKTRGYMATVLTLYLMALEIGKAKGHVTNACYDKEISKFSKMIEAGKGYMASCNDFYEKYEQQLFKAKSYMFVGKGAAGNVAEESALKVLETVCCPAMGYEYEEFLHGPACCATEDIAVFLFLCNDADKNRMLKTAKILDKATHNCYIISHDDAIQGDKVLYLPCANPQTMSPFTDILIAQLISAVVPGKLGISRHSAVHDIFNDMDTKVKP